MDLVMDKGQSGRNLSLPINNSDRGLLMVEDNLNWIDNSIIIGEVMGFSHSLRHQNQSSYRPLDKPVYTITGENLNSLALNSQVKSFNISTSDVTTTKFLLLPDDIKIYMKIYDTNRHHILRSELNIFFFKIQRLNFALNCKCHVMIFLGVVLLYSKITPLMAFFLNEFLFFKILDLIYLLP